MRIQSIVLFIVVTLLMLGVAIYMFSAQQYVIAAILLFAVVLGTARGLFLIRKRR